MTSKIRVEVTDEALAAQVKDGGDALRSLCREEVLLFDQYLKNFGGDYRDGLTEWERSVVEGFLYQKIRGHLDPKT